MIKVYVKKQSSTYAFDTRKIKDRLKSFLKSQGIVSDAEVQIFVSGEKYMKDLARTYLGEKDTLHNVLSFPDNETKEPFFYPKKDLLHLGSIVVCYPEAIREANAEGKQVDKKIYELVEHGALHLLGVHHE